MLFPGEVVEVMRGAPDKEGEDTQKMHEDGADGGVRRRAVRVKIAGYNHLEEPEEDKRSVRGWISVEEQTESKENRRTGKCCCWPRRVEMKVFNDVAVLEEERLHTLLDSDNLPASLLNRKSIKSSDEHGQNRAQRKRQYAKMISTTDSLDAKDFALSFGGQLKHTFEQGTLLEVKKFACVTRGSFGSQMFEMDDEAVCYERKDDGKYLAWEWSYPRRGQWKWFNAESCEMLHQAKESAAKEAAGKVGAKVKPRELKENEGFTLGTNVTPEDYKFDPLKVNTEGHMILISKQTNKNIDVRLVSVDIAYLSDSWNRLDCFVVITSWATFILEQAKVDLPFKTSSLRALRVMRVLRSMRFFSGIRIILAVLGQSVGAMNNIVGFLLFVYCILGIVGVQMFRGRLQYRCSTHFPQADASGWDFEWMGIGDPTGPSDVFKNAPYCYPETDDDGFFMTNQCTGRCAGNMDVTLPAYSPTLKSLRAGAAGSTAWIAGDEHSGMFDRLDEDGSNTLGQDEVETMLRYMGTNAPRAPSKEQVTAAIASMASVATDITAANFNSWWNRTSPCIPCYAAASCQGKTGTNGLPMQCYYFGNPGFGTHGFDHILMSWHTIFIMMTRQRISWRTSTQGLGRPFRGGLASLLS
jgi:hypothetical protein